MRRLLPLAALFAAASASAACTAPPRAAVPADRPYVLMVQGESEIETPRARVKGESRGFARLSLDTGFATLEVWESMQCGVGQPEQHAHRSAMAWHAGDAMTVEDALVVSFAEAMPRCRSFDAGGRAGDEHACPGADTRFALVCRPSALIVDERGADREGVLRPASALRCLIDGEAPTSLQQMAVDGALWFPLADDVRLSRVEGLAGDSIRFEPAPPGWSALEQPVAEP